ncbi:MAG TPA: type II toxin-antitoxin system VapC family toxin [Acetobacteraceae bacterium]|jgi:ribonuclease VapC|nr:type II toxin-antitoxin system VapC family toxin [Acetobacteraceae bacterium]
MILDTSAIIAAIAAEPDGTQFQTAMEGAKSPVIAAITVLETRIVLHGRRQLALAQAFDVMLQRAGIEVVPLDADLAHAAFEAFRRYGKGQGHPAQLNIVDCVAYALAKNRNDTLLLKGGDFAKTDIQSAH